MIITSERHHLVNTRSLAHLQNKAMRLAEMIITSENFYSLTLDVLVRLRIALGGKTITSENIYFC